MQTSYDCIPCMLNGILGLFKRGLIGEKYQETLIREVLKYYSNADFRESPLLTNRNLHKLIREISGNTDPYKQLKDKYNHEALRFYEKYRKEVFESDDPFDMAMRLAIAGNIIDFGPGHIFDVEETIEKVLNSDFAVDHSLEFKKSIQEAKSIVYLADNAGEIVFDKLFLEVINRPDITFVVRHSPILNDATMEDVEFLGIDKLASVMTNGDCAPGTLLSLVSEEFKEKFDKADLIISKGQGNFEGLSEVTDKNIFFLLMIKCHIIAEDLGITKGDYIIKSALKQTLEV